MPLKRLIAHKQRAYNCTATLRCLLCRWYNKATQNHIESALRLYGSAPLVTVLHPPVEPFPAPADEVEADKALLAAARQAGSDTLVGEVSSLAAQARRSLQGSFSWKTDGDAQGGAAGTAAGAAAVGAAGAASTAGAAVAAGAADLPGAAGWEGTAAAASVGARRKDIMMLGRFFRGRQSKVGGDSAGLHEWVGVGAMTCVLQAGLAVLLQLGLSAACCAHHLQAQPAAVQVPPGGHFGVLSSFTLPCPPLYPGPWLRHRNFPLHPAISAGRHAAAPHRQPDAQPHQLPGRPAQGKARVTSLLAACLCCLHSLCDAGLLRLGVPNQSSYLDDLRKASPGSLTCNATPDLHVGR